MNDANILLIEDDEIVARTIERSLRGKEFHLTKAKTGVEGLKMCRHSPPDLVLLDVIMPGMDGYAVCREIRADPLLKNLPVILLTGKIKDEDRISGFNAGADDYICKPFNIDELILRIRAVLRRSKSIHAETPVAEKQSESGSISREMQGILESITKNTTTIEANHCLILGEYLLNTRSHELYTKSKGKLLLTPVQFDLLYHLMSHPGQVFSPARLLDEVWDYPSHSGSPDLVRVHIKNLRERIEEDSSNPKFILTVPGYGYTISPSS
jgi:DNA-binding response OmpR family regulator